MRQTFLGSSCGLFHPPPVYPLLPFYKLINKAMWSVFKYQDQQWFSNFSRDGWGQELSSSELFPSRDTTSVQEYPAVLVTSQPYRGVPYSVSNQYNVFVISIFLGTFLQTTGSIMTTFDHGPWSVSVETSALLEPKRTFGADHASQKICHITFIQESITTRYLREDSFTCTSSRSRILKR